MLYRWASFSFYGYLNRRSVTVVMHERRRREEEKAKASSAVTEAKKLIAQVNIPEYAF
jgi:hypothetical protein